MSSLSSTDWDARYAGAELVWGAGPNRSVVRDFTGRPPGRALDLAAGEGRNALWLAEQGWQVLAIDFSAVAIERGHRLAAERGLEVSWVVADVLSAGLPDRAFDAVLVAYLHLPAPDRAAVLARAAAALAPGGTLLVVGHDRSNLTGGAGAHKTRTCSTPRTRSSTPCPVWTSDAPGRCCGRSRAARRPRATPSWSPPGPGEPFLHTLCMPVAQRRHTGG